MSEIIEIPKSIRLLQKICCKQTTSLLAVEFISFKNSLSSFTWLVFQKTLRIENVFPNLI